MMKHRLNSQTRAKHVKVTLYLVAIIKLPKKIIILLKLSEQKVTMCQARLNHLLIVDMSRYSPFLLICIIHLSG